MDDQKTQREDFRRRLLVFSPIAIILILSLVFATLSFINRGRITVDLVIAPGDSLIVLNGRKIRAGENKLSPGDYMLSVTKDGFESVEYSFSISHNQEPVTIPIGLRPANNNLSLMSEYENDYALFEQASGDLAAKEGEKFYDDNPIARKLPYRGPIYNIDYRLDDTGQGIVIQITLLDPSAKKAALSQLTYWGYDPNSLSIEYLSPSQ